MAGLPNRTVRSGAEVCRRRPALASARTTVAGLGSRIESLDRQRRVAIDRGMNTRGEKLAVSAAKLDALSPLGVLTRGYSITEGADGRIIRDASTVARGDKLKIRLERGKLSAEVLSSEKDDG